MKLKYLPLLAILLIGVVLISGCAKQEEVTPASTEPVGITSPPPGEVTPSFELKELHADVWKPDNTRGSIFKFNYSTNQDFLYMDFVGPDGSSNDFTLSGAGENSGWASIPPKGEFVKLPGTYKMTVNASTWPPTKILEKDFTFSGAKLSIVNISVSNWKHFYSCPVHEFWPDVMITVSNNGDLPAYARIKSWFDGKDMTFGSYGLGYVGAGEQQVFSKLPLNAMTTQPGQHTISAELISYLPSDKTEYYRSSKNPYTVVPVSEKNTYEYLLLGTYSTTAQTPQNTPEIQRLVDNCCAVAPKYCE